MGALELADNIFQILVLGVLVIFSSRIFLKKPEFKIFVYFLGAIGCYFLGDIFWTLYFVIKGDFPYYISISDISYVAAYTFLIIMGFAQKKEYASYDLSTKEKFVGVGLFAFAIVDVLVCYLLVGGLLWNLMYGVPLAILAYVTSANIFIFAKDKRQKHFYHYNISVMAFFVLNNIMFLVSSMGWNNFYIAADFLTTLNFILMFHSLTKGDMA